MSASTLYARRSTWRRSARVHRQADILAGCPKLLLEASRPYNIRQDSSQAKRQFPGNSAGTQWHACLRIYPQRVKALKSCSHLWADVIAGAHYRRQLLPGAPAAHVRVYTRPYLTQSKHAAMWLCHAVSLHHTFCCLSYYVVHCCRNTASPLLLWSQTTRSCIASVAESCKAPHVAGQAGGAPVRAQAKVAQLQHRIVAGRGQQEVLRLDVPVHHAQLVQVVHHLHHRPEVLCAHTRPFRCCPRRCSGTRRPLSA